VGTTTLKNRRQSGGDLDGRESRSTLIDCISGQTVNLNRRQQQITDLLLQGCGNAEIANLLKMKRRTVKAHFKRLFLRFGISDGIKRVKLATLLYRRQLVQDASVAADDVLTTNGSRGSVPKKQSLRTPEMKGRDLLPCQRSVH
jgi:hypothetical protein